MIRRQLGNGREHPEVGIALIRIELTQQLAVIFETIRVIIVVRREEAPPTRFARHQLAAQATIGIAFIADEVDTANAGDRSFGNLEDQIDPVLRLLDDLGRHGRGKATGATIDFDDTLDVGLDPRAREDRARLGLDLVGDLLVIDRAVPLEDDAVDDRVFLHPDDHDLAAILHLHVGKQAGRKQGLDRQVDQAAVKRLARLEQQVGQDRVGLDPLIALNQDLPDHRSRNRLLHLGLGGCGNFRTRLLCRGYRRHAHSHQGCEKHAQYTHHGRSPLAGPGQKIWPSR